MLTLSFAATEGIQGKRTMRFQGMVQDSEWLLLVDSGSSTTFISQAAVQKLQYSVQEAPLVHVTTANGDKLSSSIIVPEVGIHKGIHSPPQQEYWTLLTMI